ncbi:hypothetical protein M8A51_22335 [Schlegelella sp. S2-27]|uniref:Phosphotransferase enzyme family protein n=1 Tax=Caldimonas mangrovi TaxID=2944811 RepID=A0ABT0YVF9_9BURK|nr:hypothetical protein [Caldimonas mangrovi]MCM5682277.1 hypothetical protein [Caldimonas mangrovi]
MQTSDASSLSAQRQARQLAFAASGDDIEIGSLAGLPWSADELRALTGGEPQVVQRFDRGLTAIVYRLSDGRRHWTLKQARVPSLVKNVDGQTSFLNEVQRRADLTRLKQRPGGAQRWSAIVDTQYASFRQGLIVSPWLEGELATHWGERQIAQLLDAACTLWCEGLFEWDYSPGNLLDDGRQVRLFDFGYMYAFDPLRHFNTAGRGNDTPMFHPAERFETRAYSGWLLALQARQGEAAALAAFRLEKELALDAYRRMRARIAAAGANADVLGWLDGMTARWSDALRSGIEPLFLAEQWRSHLLDVDDDLSGQSCTPLTLQRLDWLQHTLQHHHAELCAAGGLFWGDEHKTPPQLSGELHARRGLAQRYQLAHG